MRSQSQTRALLRSGRVLSRTLSSVEETSTAPFRYRTAPCSTPVLRQSPSCASIRPFSQTAAAAKKKQQQEQKAPKSNNPTPSSSSSSGAGAGAGAPTPNPEDPFDLSDLEHAFAKGAEHHLNELTKARAGGRFNPDILGQLRVRPDRQSPETFPLHELAAIVPRQGTRKVSILVHEAANVKAVLTAVQASPDFNQQPQKSEDNEQELVLTVQAEDPQETAKRLKDILNAWRQQVRDAKHKREQTVKKWLKDRKIVQDDVKRLDKEMQKLQDKKMAEIKAKEKEVEGKS